MIIRRIEKIATPGKVIPKPRTKNEFIVKGWGNRRGQRALIYLIPNHKNPSKPREKGVNISEWEKAYHRLMSNGSLTGKWFKKNMQACANEGYCNFTTIGGVFALLGLATYEERQYIKK